MKKETLTILISALFLITIILGFTSCDALIAPAKGRENPADPLNPVPIITDFSVSDKTENSVTLSWIPQADTSGSYPRLLILYNTSAEPVNISDGTSAVDMALDSTTLEQTIPDLSNSTTYYFSAWTYSEIDGENVYTGPLSVSGQTYKEHKTETVSLGADGYVDSNLTRYFGGTGLIAGFAVHQNITLIRFTGLPGNSTFISAVLTIYCNGSPATTQDIELKNIVQTWDEGSVDYIDVVMPDFSEHIMNGVRTFGPGFSGDIVFEVAEVFNNLKSGGVHHGFLIQGPGTESFLFAASEHAADPGPSLVVDYYLLPD